jgi:hypothetical protein
MTPALTTELAVAALADHAVYEAGSIVTVRLPGHSRSPNGAEYWSTAFVLAQYEPDGQIAIMVLDPFAGMHFDPAFSVRDIGSRGDGTNEREMYEVRSNVGDVLFSPNAFDQMKERLFVLEEQVRFLRRDQSAKIADVKPVAPPLASPVSSPVATQNKRP